VGFNADFLAIDSVFKSTEVFTFGLGSMAAFSSWDNPLGWEIGTLKLPFFAIFFLEAISGKLVVRSVLCRCLFRGQIWKARTRVQGWRLVLTGEDSYNKIHLTEHSSFTLKSESSRMLPFYDPNAFLMSFGFQLDILVSSTLQHFSRTLSCI